jgi:tripartite-type tricarboxylate transporter receptor subunit TctC
MKKDFTYIMQYGAYAFIFCCLSESPWKNFREFVEEARKKPAQMKYSSSGPQSAQHIFMEQVFKMEKVTLNHIPTSGGAEATRQLLGGHLEGAITPDFIPHIKSGKVRGLGLQGPRRIEWVSDIPTFYELGYKMPTVNWMGIGAPAGLHPAILKKLSDAFKKVYDDPDFQDSMAKLYLPTVYKYSEGFRNLVFQDFDNMEKVIKNLGFAK